MVAEYQISLRSLKRILREDHTVYCAYYISNVHVRSLELLSEGSVRYLYVTSCMRGPAPPHTSIRRNRCERHVRIEITNNKNTSQIYWICASRVCSMCFRNMWARVVCDFESLGWTSMDGRQRYRDSVCVLCVHEHHTDEWNEYTFEFIKLMADVCAFCAGTTKTKILP